MSEYDLEELNATRKINGVDDGLYTETIEVLQKELERKNKELDNYLETHKDYLSDEAEAIRKDIHRLINKIALLEKSATKKEENVANMTEEAFNEIIDNFEIVAHLTMYGRKGIKENVKKLQARIKELEEEKKNKDTYIKMAKEVIENSIIKQKVKALKESVILDNTIVGGRRNAKTLEYGIKLGKIKACEELLEEDK